MHIILVIRIFFDHHIMTLLIAIACSVHLKFSSTISGIFIQILHRRAKLPTRNGDRRVINGFWFPVRTDVAYHSCDEKSFDHHIMT